jgi:hypothetical protein
MFYFWIKPMKNKNRVFNKIVLFTVAISLLYPLVTAIPIDHQPYQHSMRRALIVRIELSDEAYSIVGDIVEEINSELVGEVLSPLPYAYVSFQDRSMIRDESGNIIDNGLIQNVNLMLLVDDPRYAGFSLLSLGIYPVSTMKTEIETKDGSTKAKDYWEVDDGLNEIEFSIKYSRLEPTYLPVVDVTVYEEYSTTSGYRTVLDPQSFYLIHKRATLFEAEKIKKFELEFDLDDSQVQDVFTDTSNEIYFLREELSQLLVTTVPD